MAANVHLNGHDRVERYGSQNPNRQDRGSTRNENDPESFTGGMNEK